MKKIDINMELAVILVLAFFISFFIESIFGFGGLVISFAILGFFMDIKQLIYLGIFLGPMSSLFVLITDYKSFSKSKFLKMVPLALIATILGVFLIDYLSSDYLLKFFALFLIAFSLKALFFDNYIIKNNYIQKMLIIIGGLLQGVFGTGGPFTVMGVREWFKNKSELRSTLALYFIVFNIIRAIQLELQGSFDTSLIIQYWWLAIVIWIAVNLGYKIHLKISEKYFRIGIDFLILLAGIMLLIR